MSGRNEGGIFLVPKSLGCGYPMRMPGVFSFLVFLSFELFCDLPFLTSLEARLSYGVAVHLENLTIQRLDRCAILSRDAFTAAGGRGITASCTARKL